jgi:hypothetical protein
MTAIRKSCGHYALSDAANTVKSTFFGTVMYIFGYDTLGVKKRLLSKGK